MADDIERFETWTDVDSESESEISYEDDGIVYEEEVETASPALRDANKLSFKLGEDYNSPVYIQRYQTVADIIGAPIPGSRTTIKRVVDFGSAELNFFKYLKTLPNLLEVALVDIDASLLEMACVKTRPLAFDYLHKRKKPLNVRVFAGSVADRDERIQGVDAVTCIELIEHLNDDVLHVLPDVIFGYIHPKLVAITTPNAEFNVLFPDSTGFRHWDHKFEWTRLQFRKWCLSVVEKFPDYTFTVSGIGEGPPGSEHLGCCSQMAVFISMNPHKKHTEEIGSTPYHLVAENVYPAERNRKSTKEQTILTAEYYVHMLGRYLVDSEAEGDTVQVPLQKILQFPQMSQHSCDEIKLSELLSEKGWEIKEENGAHLLLYTIQEDEDSEEEEEHVGDGDTEVCVLVENIDKVDLSGMNAFGDCLEDWDAT